jgi:hypothetical protein
MNLLSLVGPRLDNICQIRRKWYYSSGWTNLQTKRGLNGWSHLGGVEEVWAYLFICFYFILFYFILLNICLVILVGSRWFVIFLSLCILVWVVSYLCGFKNLQTALCLWVVHAHYAGLAIRVCGREACKGARVGKRVRYTSRFTTFNQDNGMQVEDHVLLPLDVRHNGRRVRAAQCRACRCSGSSRMSIVSTRAEMEHRAPVPDAQPREIERGLRLRLWRTESYLFHGYSYIYIGRRTHYLHIN